MSNTSVKINTLEHKHQVTHLSIFVRTPTGAENANGLGSGTSLGSGSRLGSGTRLGSGEKLKERVGSGTWPKNYEIGFREHRI